ncbi:MAG: hypothetical protein IJV83_00080 [Clostridia bacterium]|nr:hypothetical protein [Clostridia bacterium]
MVHFYNAQVLFEISADVRGDSYLVIYGKHVNGYFCCIPNWGIGCEMAEPSDIFYNTEKLLFAKCPKYSAKDIATYIQKAAMSLRKEQ